MSFCIQGIQNFSLGTFKIGMILLCGLFFYDIFWVFGTDVMVTVAKNLDGPIKILFPRSLLLNEAGKMADMSLLGLGDIVIPGFFISLLLRFDAINARVPTAKINIHSSFFKPYFISSMVGYVVGLATTLYVMLVFKTLNQVRSLTTSRRGGRRGCNPATTRKAFPASSRSCRATSRPYIIAMIVE